GPRRPGGGGAPRRGSPRDRGVRPGPHGERPDAPARGLRLRRATARSDGLHQRPEVRRGPAGRGRLPPRGDQPRGGRAHPRRPAFLPPRSDADRRLRPAVPVAAPATGMEALNLAHAGILTAFFALPLRAAVLAFPGRQPRLVSALRVLASAGLLALGSLYALFTASMLVWNAPAVGGAILVGVLVLSGVAMRRALGWAARTPGA